MPAFPASHRSNLMEERYSKSNRTGTISRGFIPLLFLAMLLVLVGCSQQVDTGPDVTATPALDQLLADLQDERPEVRLAAVLKLGDMQDASAVEPLMALLQSDPAPEVRAEAARVLGEFQDARVIPVLVEALRDEDLRVPSSAAGALVRIGSPAVEPLLPMLEEADPNLRAWAALVLGELRDARRGGSAGRSPAI